MQITKDQLTETSWDQVEFTINSQGKILNVYRDGCIFRIQNYWYNLKQLNDLGFKFFKRNTCTFDEALNTPGTYVSVKSPCWALQVSGDGVLTYFGEIVNGYFQQEEQGGVNIGRFRERYVLVEADNVECAHDEIYDAIKFITENRGWEIEPEKDRVWRVRFPIVDPRDNKVRMSPWVEKGKLRLIELAKAAGFKAPTKEKT